MGPVFWLRRFLLVFVGAAMVIAVAQLVSTVHRLRRPGVYDGG